MRCDFIIVGQGLAGSLLASSLRGRGLRPVVVDDGWKTSASKVAAGLMTPLTGRRFTLTPEYPGLFSVASRVLGQEGVLRPMQVYRAFVDDEQRRRGLSRAEDPSCAPFVVRSTEGQGSLHPDLDDPLGGVLMQGAWTDLPALLSRHRESLRQDGLLIEDRLDSDDVAVSGCGIVWKGLTARGIVHCDGYRSAVSGPFKRLGWQPAKGEALTLSSDAPVPPFVLNREGWAIPHGEGVWRTGTNWEWAALDESVSAIQRDKLVGRFRGFFRTPVSVEVLEQQAGVRPCTADSRPYLGTHPEIPCVHLFNGLGPRGTVWAPAMAELMADHLLGRAAIPQELDLRRSWPA